MCARAPGFQGFNLEVNGIHAKQSEVDRVVGCGKPERVIHISCSCPAKLRTELKLPTGKYKCLRRGKKTTQRNMQFSCKSQQKKTFLEVICQTLACITSWRLLLRQPALQVKALFLRWSANQSNPVGELTMNTSFCVQTSGRSINGRGTHKLLPILGNYKKR